MSSVISQLRKTIQEHALIKPDDRIAVGLSGGKDSMVLLHALKTFQRFSPIPYALEAITINLGFNNFNLSTAKSFCSELNMPYSVIDTDIADIVFNIRDEKNPCALCAHMRRGALAHAMNERNLNVLALGHHADDVLSTFMLNLLHTGKLNTLEYNSHLDRSNIEVIRPLLDISEAMIIGYSRTHTIPIIKSPCPVDRKTKRESMNQLLKEIYKTSPNARKNMLTAIRNDEQCNLFTHKMPL